MPAYFTHLCNGRKSHVTAIAMHHAGTAQTAGSPTTLEALRAPPIVGLLLRVGLLLLGLLLRRLD